MFPLRGLGFPSVRIGVNRCGKEETGTCANGFFSKLATLSLPYRVTEEYQIAFFCDNLFLATSVITLTPFPRER